MEPRALIFDIETIADLTAENRDAIGALAATREQTAEEYGAFCPPLARVVCIAWLDVARHALGACFDTTLCTQEPPAVLTVPGSAGEPREIECATEGCDGERQVLQQFGRRIEQHLRQAQAHLVTYNGRGFDLPVLVQRGLKHHVTEGRALLVKAARESRYNPMLHVDLMDVVTFSGAAPRWPLAAYAVGYGYRSPKSDMDGSRVWATVQAGRIIDVVRYCAGDVLATAHVYRALGDLVPAPAGAKG